MRSDSSDSQENKEKIVKNWTIYDDSITGENNDNSDNTEDRVGKVVFMSTLTFCGFILDT